MDPKLIEVPGIPGKLQEQTIDQFVSVLDPDHLVRKQLNELRANALKAVDFANQLVAAKEKIMELQDRLMQYSTAKEAEVPPKNLMQKVFQK